MYRKQFAVFQQTAKKWEKRWMWSIAGYTMRVSARMKYVLNLFCKINTGLSSRIYSA